MKVFTPSSCVSSMVSPYFFTLVKLSSGYTARLYRMLHATKKKTKRNRIIKSVSRKKPPNLLSPI